MLISQRFTSVARHRTLKLPRSQKILAVVAITFLVLLGISSIYQSRTTGERTQLLSNTETPSASIIFTQRETLVYSTQLALWSNGGTTRREVQIARALLGQRLAVIDASGRSMGSRANAGYWRALAASDALVAQSPPGILPESMHQELNLKLIPVIDEIVSQARALVVSYQRSVDNEMKAIAEETARRDALNLTLLYLFIATASLFLYLNTRFNLRNYKKAREDIERERAALESARIEVTKLQDLDSAKNALISNVNHELRTPLTSIIGYIELLQNEDRDAQSPEHRLHLEVLQRNSLILLNLVESLLSLSKFDGAVGMLPNTPVSLQAVIDDALFTLKPALEKSQIEAEFTFDRDYTVRGDRAQLNQVIINVVANSIKFSHPHKKIRITLSSRLSQQAKESVVISISDEGIGIPESEISLIFDRFYRSKSLPSDRYEGTGLGLAIVKQVVDHHFGEIEVHSTLGAGTLFEIVLPLLERKDNE